MKLKGLAKNLFIGFISIVLIGMIFLTVGSVKEKTLLTVQKFESINQGENEGATAPQIHTVNMIINELNKQSGERIEGAKLNFSYGEEISIAVNSISDSSPILPDENEVYEIPADGVNIQVSGVEDGKSYDLTVEQRGVKEGFSSTFKRAVVTIDATDGKLECFVKEIVKEEQGEEVVTTGSKEDTAIFMYETDGNSRIKISENEDVELYYTTSSINAELSAEELEHADWIEYNKEQGISLEKNAIIYSKSKYKTGDYSEIEKTNITNIDKAVPQIEVTTKTEQEENETSFSVRITDVASTDYGASGIIGYALTQENNQPENFTECENSVEVETEFTGIGSNGTYYLWAKDEAGNVGKKEFEITNITEKVVAIILSSPFDELNGKEYLSLRDLLQELKEHEQQEVVGNNNKAVIQMVNDDRKETVTFDDNTLDIELDLNGYTISSNSNSAVFTVENGNLQVVDNKYNISDFILDTAKLQDLQSKYSANSNQDGKIKSDGYIAVEILEGGKFILGVEDNLVKTDTPIIEGVEKGIFNNGGELGFFDGIIYGSLTIDGEITYKPVLYDLTTSQTETDGIFKSFLAQVSGIEALIGKTRYTKIETAIDVANKITGTSEEQIQIDLVTDIVLDSSRGTLNDNGEIIIPGCLLVDNSKNIKINLNGRSLTNTVANYVIKNSGKLEIIDSSMNDVEDKSTIIGKIESSTNEAIYNEGELKITSGAVVQSKVGTSGTYKYAISNIGDLTVNGGNVISSVSYTGAIKNSGEGTTTIYDGNVKGNNYAFLNEQNASLVINGGNVTSENSHAIYATGNSNNTVTINSGNIIASNTNAVIRNASTGSMTVTGGNITGKAAIEITGKGSLNITGGTITANATGEICRVLSSNGKVTIDGGTFEQVAGYNNSGALLNNGTNQFIFNGRNY